jgi:hypothetical protein
MHLCTGLYQLCYTVQIFMRNAKFMSSCTFYRWTFRIFVILRVDQNHSVNHMVWLVRNKEYWNTDIRSLRKNGNMSSSRKVIFWIIGVTGVSDNWSDYPWSILCITLWRRQFCFFFQYALIFFYKYHRQSSSCMHDTRQLLMLILISVKIFPNISTTENQLFCAANTSIFF